MKGWCSSCASSLADKSIMGERFIVRINKEINYNVQHAVVAVWTTWDSEGMELSHNFPLIILQVWSKIIYNPISVRDVLHCRITFLLWDIDEFWQFTVRLIGFRFCGGMWSQWV